jgi:hypothetical protein
MPLTWIGEAFDYPADPESGATRVRLTTSLMHHCNIYCEHSYSSPDGRRIGILRSFNADPRIPPSDLLVADLYTLKLAVVERNVQSIVVGTASWSGWLYYLNGAHELMRVNIATLEKEVVWTAWPFNPDFIFHTVSPDLRYLVGQVLQPSYKTALIRIDLVEKSWKLIYEDYEISNAHPLYNPVHGRDISVMKAGGFAVNDRREVKDLDRPRIITHFFIDHEGGNVRSLPLGPPHSPNSTGHTGWMSDTGRLACVTAWDFTRYRPLPQFPDGNIFWAGPHDREPRCFRCPEHAFQHIGVSRCGRYFVAESYAAGIPGPVPLIVGHFESGRYRPLLTDCRASGGASAVSHPHAYFTADNRHVIYNADPTMIGHVYAARVPDDFLKSLD